MADEPKFFEPSGTTSFIRILPPYKNKNYYLNVEKHWFNRDSLLAPVHCTWYPISQKKPANPYDKLIRFDL